MSDDRRLLLQMHKGHEAAARELWRRTAPQLFSYARSIVAGGADDVVQSVFITVLEQPRRVIEKVEDPLAWLLVLTRRNALNHLRSVRRDIARRQAVADIEKPTRQSQGAEGEQLTRAMETLPRRLREVVVLRHIAGLTFDQVATAVGANRNTAAARYREAIRRLRLVLDVADAGVFAGSAT